MVDFDVQRDIDGTTADVEAGRRDHEPGRLAAIPLVHYDRDYERIAAVTGQEHSWFVPDGALA